MSKKLWLGTTLAAAGWLGAPALADTVTLRNGREIHGRLVQEAKDSIRVRIQTGVIVIPKHEIATFNQNANYGEYAKPRSRQEIEAEEAKRKADEEAARKGGKAGGAGDRRPSDGGPSGTTPKSGDAKPADSKPGDPATYTKEGWVWDKAVTEEQAKALAPLRDKSLEDLAKLGPTKEERLKKLDLSSEETADLKDRISRMGFNRNTRRGGGGSANLRRDNALGEVVSRFGVKAIPELVRSTGSASEWVSRMSAAGLGELAGKGEPEDTRWLMYHFDAPAALLRLLDHQGEQTSPFIRLVANESLEAITKAGQGWPKNATDSMRNEDESTAYRGWVEWWRKAKAEWEKKEQEKEEERGKLKERLDQIRGGEDPDKPKDDKGEKGEKGEKGSTER